jgi:hypothetical protein
MPVAADELNRAAHVGAINVRRAWRHAAAGVIRDADTPSSSPSPRNRRKSGVLPSTAGRGAHRGVNVTRDPCRVMEHEQANR